MNAPPETTHWAPILLPALFSALSGLVGVILGGWITNRNQSRERRHRRYEEQLRFYAELFSIRSLIRAKSELRQRLSVIAHKAWNEEVEQTLGHSTSPLRDELYKQRSDEYDKLADYSDAQLRDELIPLYHKMLDHWTANMAQGEPSTQRHFATLVDYVEIWDRFLKRTLPAAVIKELGHEEKKLYPLYEDIERNVSRLRAELLK
jgi:hypothetical protein